MLFEVASYTDIGITRSSNQDSICVKRGLLDKEEIVMAAVCDGMGGLEKGEVASAEIIRFFSEWFEGLSKNTVEKQWENLPFFLCACLERLNQKIYQYGQDRNMCIGSTFSGILLWNQKYLVVHIGDSRIYQITDQAKKMTTDHVHPKCRNLLTRCIGSRFIPELEILNGNFEAGTVFLICSDGFWHEISTGEIGGWFAPNICFDQKSMRERCRRAVKEIENRGEKDNISVIVVKAEESTENAPGWDEAMKSSDKIKVLESELYTCTEEKISAIDI